MSQTIISDTAMNLHREVPVADLHIDFLLTNYLFGYDIMKRHENPLPYSPFVNHTDIPRLLDAGVQIVGAGLVCSPLKIYAGKRFYQISSQLNYLKTRCQLHPDKIRHLKTVKDMDDAVKDGAVACLPGVEGSHVLNGNLNTLDTLYHMGVRYWTMAHFSGNEACNCPRGIYNNNSPGLTKFGRQLVERIHELGIILDLAHTERKAFLEAAKMSPKPVIVSHTGLAGVHNVWRNIDDEQLEAVANTGGVVGIIIAPNYLGGTKFGPVSLVADHIMHAVKVIGADHVDIGSDLDGWIPTMPKGFSDVRDITMITEDLLQRGMSKSDVRKILSENVTRVIRQCLS